LETTQKRNPRGEVCCDLIATTTTSHATEKLTRPRGCRLWNAKQEGFERGEEKGNGWRVERTREEREEGG